MNDGFMGGLKTILLALLGLSAFGTDARAANDADALVRAFAECAGRLTAAVDHQRLFFGDVPPELEQAQITMMAVLDAAAPTDNRIYVTSWQVSARAAQNALLSQATLSFDAQTAQWAQQRSDQLISDCQAFVLF